MVMPPVGYKRPNFPALYFPLGTHKYDYESSFLYKFQDIWMFTTVWTVIWMTGLYLGCSIIILLTHYFILGQNIKCKNNINNNGNDQLSVDEQNNDLQIVNVDDFKDNPTYKSYFTSSIISGNKNTVFITAFGYIIVGAFQGFLSGSVVGIVLGAIYDAAQFRMTTWIPFVFSLVITLYNIASAYPFTVRGM